MWRIAQISDTEWEIVDDAGVRVGDVHASYPLAVAFLGGLLWLAEGDGATAADGLLPEPWVADPAIAFAEDTGDGRDFSTVVWSARDPQVSTLPLMLQTETEMGHMGAQLAGFFETVSDLGAGTNPGAGGRFYDNEAGRTFRDMLLDGRSFGVSVDPGAVEVDWECTEEDEDGFCIAETTTFTSYEIIGVTGTPFPAFEAAAIRLDVEQPAEDEAPVAASAVEGSTTNREGQEVTRFSVPRTAGVTASTTTLSSGPPAAWFRTAEPVMGERFELGDLGDEWLVDQGQGRVAMPLTITADGRLAGHLAVWGACHVGYPGTCVTPPESAAAYAHFHVGEVLTAEGERIPVGALNASCDHAATALRAPEAQDHYAHNGVAWANVRVSNGEFGPWVAGALRPGVTDAQLAVLRAGALSGDWRRIGGQLELIAALAVTTPGFPISREAIVASGLRVTAAPRVRASLAGREQVSLIASGLVRRCPDCARRADARTSRTEYLDLGAFDLSDIRGMLSVLERRTRHLVPAEAAHVAARLRPRG